MKGKLVNTLWGGMLIVGGLLFLGQNMDLIPELSPEVWKFVCVILSILFFATYFLSGKEQWGWLFPACIFAGTALTISLAETGVDGSIVAAPVLAGVGLPFLLVFLLDRKNWWALIPMWVMAALTLLMLVVDRIPGEAIGALVLFSIGLPFVVVYLKDRKQWWALIPAGILIVVGFIPLLTMGASGEFIAAFVMASIALPFLMVYFTSEKNWWAMIPCGVMASIGLMLLLSAAVHDPGRKIAVMNGVFFLGLAITFTVLWMRRATQPTEWAKYPAITLYFVALGALILGISFNTFWPLFPIILGLVIMYFGFKPQKG